MEAKSRLTEVCSNLNRKPSGDLLSLVKRRVINSFPGDQISMWISMWRSDFLCMQIRQKIVET